MRFKLLHFFNPGLNHWTPAGSNLKNVSLCITMETIFLFMFLLYWMTFFEPERLQLAVRILPFGGQKLGSQGSWTVVAQVQLLQMGRVGAQGCIQTNTAVL